MVGPLTKDRYLICDHHGAYVIDASHGKLVFGQGPGEALLTGCAYAGIELAIDKLHAARMLDPVARLALAKVTFKYETPTRAIAISSKMLPGL